MEALVFTLLEASFRNEHFVRQEQKGQRLTPLLYACKTCEFEIVEYFIDQQDVRKNRELMLLSFLVPPLLMILMLMTLKKRLVS